MIRIIDSIMGSGKSTWMISHINKYAGDRYLIVVPYLTEIERYKNGVNKQLYEPKLRYGKSKYADLIRLIKERKNIITTHQLFLRIQPDILESLKNANYVVIIDEALSVFDNMCFPTNDLNVFKKCGIISTNPQTGQIYWNEALEPESEYDYGSLLSLKEACLSNCAYDLSLGKPSNSKITTYLWCMPPEIFNCFDKVYILTYLWNGSFQKMYFDLTGYKYSVYTLNNGYPVVFEDKTEEKRLKSRAMKLITIINDPKLNNIGKKINGRHNPLSSGWYKTHSKDEQIKLLKNNVLNYFKNITKQPAKYNMWTTFETYKAKIQGNGYSGGKKNTCFLPVNTKGTNAFSHKNALAYTVNIFMNPVMKNFFKLQGLEVDEDTFATSEMIQWIWRSAIRNDKPVTLYIPSDRMRNLLLKWLNVDDQN